MIHPILYAVAPIIGAVAFRFRGGLWNTVIKRGDFVGRMVFALACAAFVIPAHGLVAFAYVTAGLCAAACLPLGDSIDLGHVEGNWLHDRIILAARGTAYTASPSAAAAIGGAVGIVAHPLPLWLAPAGMAMWLCYEAGWRSPLRIPGFAQGQTEIGEALFGAVLGIALALA